VLIIDCNTDDHIGVQSGINALEDKLDKRYCLDTSTTFSVTTIHPTGVIHKEDIR
jgi:hypothetical protein